MRATTVRALREWLEQFEDDVEVRFASAARGGQFEWEIELPEEFDTPVQAGSIDVVYLAEGRQIGYLPEEAREFVGWGEGDARRDR